MRLSPSLRNLTVALAVAGLCTSPVDAGSCGCSVNVPVYSNFFRTTLCNPAPQYVWNGGGAPPADQALTRGRTVIVCGSLAYLVPQTNGNIPTHARAWVRVGSSYSYSALVALTSPRTIRPASFGQDRVDAQNFSISFTPVAGMYAGSGSFFVEYFNNGYYNGTASGGSGGGGTPTSPAGHNLLTINVL